ncbi:MAG: hypothetical protein ACHQT8_00380 [Chlamydiales bacterium]
MSNRRKKRPFTLLEVTIALFLTSILLFFIFGFFRQTTMQNIAAQELDAKVCIYEKAEMRLATLFSSLSQEEQGKPPLFYTEHSTKGPQLIFSFQNGADTDPLFSGKIRARLLLEKNKTLELHLLPLEGEGKMRKEVLLENVKELNFEFFDLNQKTQVPKWAKEQENLPAMVYITADHGVQKTQFVFFLPPSTKPVIYP